MEVEELREKVKKLEQLRKIVQEWTDAIARDIAWSLTIYERTPDPCMQIHRLMIALEEALRATGIDPERVREYKVLKKIETACVLVKKGEEVCIKPP